MADTPGTGETPDRLRIGGLRVELPGGRPLLDDVSLSVPAGQVAVLLGGSGSGKSTFSRVLFEPESLRRDGFAVSFDHLEFDRGGLGLVPQRGALFDHLDVRGNLDLALRHGSASGSGSPAEWLDRVGLDPAFADRGARVGALSGGQAQRVAVARVLAGGRELLFLDEPSVGLDPHRVRMLGQLLRDQCARRGVAAIVVTHDVALAADIADTLYVLDPQTRRLEELFPGQWPGPLAAVVKRSELDADVEPDAEPESESGSESEPDAEPESESESESGSESEPESESESESGPESGAESEPESELDADAEPDAESESESESESDRRGRWLARIEHELVARIGALEETDRRSQTDAQPSRRRAGRSHGAVASLPRRGLRAVGRVAESVARPFAVAAQSLALAPVQLVSHPGDFLAIAGRVLRQTLLRPLLFYVLVSSLVGYTVLYVISHVAAAGVRPDALVREIGGSHIVALAPALAAILYVAASANATNAWLGNMELTRQMLAMRALGIDDRRYLWAPAFFAIAAGSLATAAAFAGGMVLGGTALCSQLGVTNGFELLTGDFLDPRPERARFTVRAAVLVWMYAWGIAADAVAKGTTRKADADDITRAMTGGVVACTLWIVAWELLSVIAVFAL